MGLVEFCESLLEVPNDVISVFGANGKADSRRRDALIGQFGFGELGVCGRGRVDYEALYIGYIASREKIYRLSINLQDFSWPPLI